MAANTENGGGRRWSRWRVAGWGLAALVLLLPLAAMQLTDEMNWGLEDFIFAGALVLGIGTAFELAVRRTGSAAYRAAAAVALAAAFMLIWINAAVGIIGSDGNAANLVYAGVLAVGVLGALLARFRPQGMARALFATALAQVLVGALALAAGWGAEGARYPLDILGLTAIFAALFAGSGLLFRKAAGE